MHKRIRLSIKLTEEEWAEVVAALQTKMSDVKLGHYPVYPELTKKWLKQLHTAHKRITSACDAKHIRY